MALRGLINSETRRQMKARVDELLDSQREANRHLDRLSAAILEMARSGQKVDPEFVLNLMKVYNNMREINADVGIYLERVILEIKSF